MSEGGGKPASWAPSRRDAGRDIGLDAVRGTSALLVLVGHAQLLTGGHAFRTEGTPIAFAVHAMATSVWLFFALSGYLMAKPWLGALIEGRPLPDVRRYATRRVTRIVPTYWLALVAVLVVAPPGVRIWQLVVHLLLLHSVVPGEADAVLFVAWTLGLEAVFYVTLPLAARAVRRLHPAPIDIDTLARGVLALAAAGLLIGLAGDLASVHPPARSPLWIVRSVPSALSMFAPGVLVALAEARADAGRPWRLHAAIRRRPGRALAVAAGLFVVARVVWLASSPVIALRAQPLWAVASGTAVAAAIGSHRPSWVVRALAGAGTISYGLYLWHWVVVQALVHHAIAPIGGSSLAGWAQSTAVLLAASVPLALLNWTLVERPAMRAAARTRTPREPEWVARPISV